MISSDLIILNNFKNELNEKYGTKCSLMRQHIRDEIINGENIINKAINQQYPIFNNNIQDDNYLTNCIFQLLHFYYHILITKKNFLDWDNNLFSESLYLIEADRVKYLNEIEKSEIIEDTLLMLFNLKSRGNEKLAYILLNEYNNKIKYQLQQGKIIN